MNQLDLSSFTITRPEKIIWRIPENSVKIVHALELIKSNSQKKFLHNIDQILSEHAINWQLVQLDKTKFLEWLPYYVSRMSEHEYRVIADEDWFDARIAEGKTVEGMFFYQNGQLICSGIFLIDGSEKATFAFKASDRIDLTSKSNSSIGSVIDYFFIKEMLQRNIKVISAGKSRNAFGVDNTLGYLEYKLRFGYHPSADEKGLSQNCVPLSADGSIAFFGIQNAVLKLFYVHPKNWQKELLAIKMLPETIELREIQY